MFKNMSRIYKIKFIIIKHSHILNITLNKNSMSRYL